MKLEYRAFREIDGDLPESVIEYVRDELRYKICKDNGLDKFLLKEIEELLAYFKPRLDKANGLLSNRMKEFIASFSGKKDFILMGIRAYQDIVMILELRKKAIEHRMQDLQTSKNLSTPTITN